MLSFFGIDRVVDRALGCGHRRVPAVRFARPGPGLDRPLPRAALDTLDYPVFDAARCSMLRLPLRRAWSILLRWVRLCWRPSAWTFDKFERGNVGACPPRLQRSPADRADRVTRMRYQELCFSAFVLGAAIASDNCRHPRNMPPRHARSTPNAAAPGPGHPRFRKARESRP